MELDFDAQIQNSNVDKVDRPVSTAIYLLLPSRNVSSLHRIPYAETWHFYLGEPLIFLQLHLGPASSNTLPASGNESITQTLRVTNSQHEKSPHAHKDSLQDEQKRCLGGGQINNLPQGLRSGAVF